MNPTHSTPSTDALDERLRRQSPAPNRPLRADFTQLVTTHISNNPRKPGLRSRIADVFRRPIIWLHTIPRLAAIAIVVVAIAGLSGAAYAAYEWIKPSATVTHITPQNDQGNRQFSVAAMCGEFMRGTLEYEISPHAQISDEDAKKVFANTCAYSAVQSFAEQKWVGDNGPDEFSKKKVGDITTLYNAVNLFVGATDANPDFGLTTGTITSLNDTSITIEAQIYQIDSVQTGPQSLATPIPVKRTLTLLHDYQAWQDGQQIAKADIQLGDTVQIVTRSQHKVQYYDDIKQNALGEQVSFGVAAIIKTDIELPYVMNQPFGNPTLTVALAHLGPCMNNEAYLCSSQPNGVLGEIYAARTDNPARPDNSKYLRADSNDDTKVKYYGLSGRVLSIDGTQLTIQTRGKTDRATIQLPYDVIREYNARANGGSSAGAKDTDIPLAVGDTVSVMYAQSGNEDHLTIKSGDLQYLVLVEYMSNNKPYKY